MMTNTWTDPTRAKIKLNVYAQLWVSERPGLRPRTWALYRWQLRKHLDPCLRDVRLGQLTTAAVRQWRAERLASRSR